MNFSFGLSQTLESKIELLKARRLEVKLGDLTFASPYLLAPMSAICHAPFRLFMEYLGAGGTVSELISCHGINYKNDRTLDMLRIDPREKNVGIQLFGEDQTAMASAAKIAQEFEPKFIDINMGCPVRKVVTKGGGSALLKDTRNLGTFFKAIKTAIEIPLTIKIRTGWDENNINALEVVKIAHEEGVNMVAIHGRTRAQAYKGSANWDIIDEVAKSSVLPILGNGDLNTASQIRHRSRHSSCQALMLGRGPLRNPFLFLETLINENEKDLFFTAKDYAEVSELLFNLLAETFSDNRTLAVQLRKHLMWFVTGFPGASDFRSEVFKIAEPIEILTLATNFFYRLDEFKKEIDFDQDFMTSGHG